MTPPTNSDVMNVRIECGADPSDDTAISDAIVAYYWQNAGGGSTVLTAAFVCEWLATNAGRINFRWSADGQSVDKTMIAAELRARAGVLRARADAAGGTGVITLIHPERTGVTVTDEFTE